MGIGAGPALSQQTITENLNNTGIPRQAPTLGLPSIYGLNPCATGATLGVTTPLFGIGGAVSDIDRECETRNNAAVVITGLKDEPLGREILCEIKDIRQAAIRVGKPCLQDQPAVKVAAALPDAQGGTQPTVSATVVSGRIRADAPAYCHFKDLELKLYPICTLAPPSKIVAGVKTARARPVDAKPVDAKPVDAKPVITKPVEFHAMIRRVAFLSLSGTSWGSDVVSHPASTGARRHRHGDCPGLSAYGGDPANPDLVTCVNDVE